MRISREMFVLSGLVLAVVALSSCAPANSPVTVEDANQAGAGAPHQARISGTTAEFPDGETGVGSAAEVSDSPIVRTGPLLQVREQFYFESLEAMAAQAEAIVLGEVLDVKPGLLVGTEEDPETTLLLDGDEDHPEGTTGAGDGSAVRLYEVELEPVRVFKGGLTGPVVVELLADPSNIEGAPYSLTSSWWRPGGQVLLFLQPSQREYADGTARWWLVTMEQGMYPVFSDGTVRVALGGGFKELEGVPAVELASILGS